MNDKELVKMIQYLRGVVREKYPRFAQVEDLMDEVPTALLETLKGVDESNHCYRSYVRRGVLMQVSNYYRKNFWTRSVNKLKPLATVEHVQREGQSVLDTTPIRPYDPNEAVRAIRVRVELDRLPSRDRDIVRGMCIEGATTAELAAKYKISRNRVSQIYVAARILLCKRLAAYRGCSSNYNACKQCGGNARKRQPLCDVCRVVNWRETLRKSSVHKKAVYASKRGSR